MNFEKNSNMTDSPHKKFSDDEFYVDKSNPTDICEHEIGIMSFFANNGINFQNPIEKYFDYCDKERAKANLEHTKILLDNPKKTQPMSLNCALYKRRKMMIK